MYTHFYFLIFKQHISIAEINSYTRRDQQSDEIVKVWLTMYIYMIYADAKTMLCLPRVTGE